MRERRVPIEHRDDGCQICGDLDFMACSACGWHVLPAHESGLCLACRTAGVTP